MLVNKLANYKLVNTIGVHYVGALLAGLKRTDSWFLFVDLIQVKSVILCNPVANTHGTKEIGPQEREKQKMHTTVLGNISKTQQANPLSRCL